MKMNLVGKLLQIKRGSANYVGIFPMCHNNMIKCLRLRETLIIVEVKIWKPMKNLKMLRLIKKIKQVET